MDLRRCLNTEVAMKRFSRLAEAIVGMVALSARASGGDGGTTKRRWLPVR
jgi:hypothetical protein